MTTRAALTVAALLSFMALTTPRATFAEPAAGCAPARAHAPGDFYETLNTGDGPREYRLHLPPSYDGRVPLPLVLFFHGAGSSHDGIANRTQFPAKADTEGFIVVLPLGTEPQGLPTGRIFDHLTFIPGMPDDVAFIDALLDKLERQLCIDTQRVYAAGFSNGAMFTVRLACDLGERLAAVAPVAGVYYPPFAAALAGAEPECSSGPVPILAIHGTADESVPFEGGPVLGLEDVLLRPIESAVLPDWAAHNRCDPTPTGSPITEHVRLVEYEQCAAETLLYVIEGGTHVWPGAKDYPDPDLNDEIIANDLIWEFFQRHALSAAPAAPSATAPSPAATPAAAQPTLTVATLPSAGATGGPSYRWAVWLLLPLALAGLSAGLWYAVRRRRAAAHE